MNLSLEGKAWKYGDDIPIDGYIMPLKYVIERLTDPFELAKHLFEQASPDFYDRARPGDILVGGKRFAQGNPHVQGFRGMAALGLGIVCESMLRSAYRNCIIAGVPVLPFCPEITARTHEGDQLRVNFESGEIFNITTDRKFYCEPMPKELIEIIRAGGSANYLKKLLQFKSV